MKKVRKAIQIISNEGLAIFIKRVLSKIVSFHPYHIYELSLSEEVEKIGPVLDLSFRFAVEDDIYRMDVETYDFKNKDKTHCINRMARGDRCLLAEHKGEVVGYMWVTADGYFELYPGKCIPLAMDKSYTYRGFVLDRYRGKRILYALDYVLNDQLRREGKRNILTLVEMTNYPAIKARERIGFKRVGRTMGIKLLGWRYNYIQEVKTPGLGEDKSRLAIKALVCDAGG